MKFNDLKNGQKINNIELCELFQCSPQGGMRRSHKSNTLVIVSNHIKSIYDDRWDGDTLYYTGMGTKGDQSLGFSQNKTLAESNSNGVTVHLFEVFEDKVYTYVGRVSLIQKPFEEVQDDENNEPRTVYIFPIQLVDNNRTVTIQDIKSVNQIRERKAKRLSNSELKLRARKSHSKAGSYRQSTTQHERSVWVSEYAKRLSQGQCQLCTEPAPFNKPNGEPYLESHHIEWLAKGGSDSVENTVALCPNCHRKMHIINDSKDVQLLKLRVQQLLQAEVE